jgi:hypothetical protein
VLRNHYKMKDDAIVQLSDQVIALSVMSLAQMNAYLEEECNGCILVL